MLKFKAKIKNSELTVKAKISSDEVISDRELDILENKNIRGFLKPSKRKRNSIEYSGPAGVSIIEHLKNPITKYEFFYIMAQILDMAKKIENNNLFLNNLILDLRYVYINENTKEIHFIYMPILLNHVCIDVMGFMEAIIYAVKPMKNQDFDFVAKYLYFLRSLNSFDVSAIEEYISKEDKDIAKQIKKQKMTQSGFIAKKLKEYNQKYKPKDLDYDEETSILQEEESIGFYQEESTTLLYECKDDYEYEATGLLNDSEGTTLLEENSASYRDSFNENIHFPSLVRISTDETISINKPVFRLGKEKSYVDYFITNNSAVSRSHADIITRGNHYFVCDQNSTNHTYINNELVPVKTEMEIYDGDVLKLANEEFLFHI
ncbi:MAG: FHA domain-containing protein [Clostridium sartagoforme]|nr:FHA domain-containing protein [Clostridium sartagoforme]